MEHTKFRTWDGKCMLYDVEHTYYSSHFGCDSFDQVIKSCEYNETFKLMYNFGFCDINNQVVYIEDIVKFKYIEDLNNVIDLVGVFVYNIDELRYELEIYNHPYYTCLSYVANGIMYDFKVIGNIYENPEVLK